MRRGDTPLVTLSSDDTTFADFDKVVVTFRQGEKIVEVDSDSMTVDGNTLSFRLTQEQTFSLLDGKQKVLVQVRLKDTNEVVTGSGIGSFDMGKILSKEVI